MTATTNFKYWLFLFLWLISNSVWAQNIPKKPKPARFVNDYAQLLSNSDAKALELKLQQYDQTTSTQIVVVTIQSISQYNAESIEELANTWGNAWGVGQKGADNGLLVLVSKNDRKVKLEVGYGLEGYIPDLRASQMIEQYLTPNFKRGNFYEGLDALADAIGRLADGGFTEEDRYYSPPSSFISPPLLIILAVGCVAVVLAFVFWAGIRISHKKAYNTIGQLLEKKALWEQLKDTYYPHQVDAKREELRGMYAVLSPKFSNSSRKQVVSLLKLLMEVRYKGEKYFQKRNDATLQQASRRLKQYLQDPIYDKDSCLAVKDRLDIEVNYFEPKAMEVLSEMDRIRLDEANERYIVLISQPDQLLAFNVSYLSKKVEDALFKDAFWNKFRSQYLSNSISSTRSRWSNDYHQIKSIGNSRSLGKALYQFYINRIERIRQSPQKFLKRKPAPKPRRSSSSYRGGFGRGFGSGSSFGSSSGSSFGGGSFGGGGATGSW